MVEKTFPEDDEQRWALVIGANQALNAQDIRLHDKLHAVEDADEIAKVLAGEYGRFKLFCPPRKERVLTSFLTRGRLNDTLASLHRYYRCLLLLSLITRGWGCMTLDYLADDEDLERYNDVFLTREDIQTISTPDKLAVLFTKLRYATDTRLEQTLTTLDITSERLRSVVKYVERIAYHHDFEGLVVYLFELRSLTVSIRNEPVQNFRKFKRLV